MRPGTQRLPLAQSVASRRARAIRRLPSCCRSRVIDLSQTYRASRPPLDPRGTRRPLRGRQPPRRAAAQRGSGHHPGAADRAPRHRDPVRRHAQRRDPPRSRPTRRRPGEARGRTARHRRDQRGRRPAPLPPSARARRPRTRLHRRRVAAGHLRRGGAAARVLAAGPGATVPRPADPGGGALAVKLDRLPRRGLSRNPGGARRHARSPARRVRVRRGRHALRLARGVALRAECLCDASARPARRRRGRPPSLWRKGGSTRRPPGVLLSGRARVPPRVSKRRLSASGRVTGADNARAGPSPAQRRRAAA